MTVLYTNNAATTLGATISNSATSMSVASGTGSLFPLPDTYNGEFFFLTLIDSGGNLEIVKVTGRTDDTMTVERAQDGTTALAFTAGSKVELRITKGMLDQIKEDVLLRDPIEGSTIHNGNVIIGSEASYGFASEAVVIGHSASIEGVPGSTDGAVAIGWFAQSYGGVAVGKDARAWAQSTVSVGKESQAQGDFSIAIGYQARTHQFSPNSITLNATGGVFGSQPLASGFFVKPIRDNTNSQTASGTLQYDSATGEIFYGAASGGGGLIGETLPEDPNDYTGAKVRLGVNTTADNSGVAVGYNTTAAANGAALGRDAVASDLFATAIGARAVAEYMSATALGGWAEAKAENAIALGGSAMVKPGAYFGVAIGGVVHDNALHGIAIGGGSSAVGNDSVAVGVGSVSNALEAIAIGKSSWVNPGADAAIAIGSDSVVDEFAAHSIVIGKNAKATQANTLVLNADAGPLVAWSSGFFVKPIRDNTNSQTSAGALQYDATTNEIFYGGGLIGFTTNDSVIGEEYKTVLGFNASVSAGEATAIGGLASAEYQGVAIGVYSAASYLGVSIGSGATTTAMHAIAIGGSTCGGMNSVAIGTANVSAYEGAIAIGHNTTVSANVGTAIGYQSSVVGGNGVAIGGSATASFANSIAINAANDILVTTSSGFFVKPVRDNTNSQTSSGTLQYDAITGEIFYAAGGGGGSLIGSTAAYDQYWFTGGGIMLGDTAFSTGNGSIAIGAQSQATGETSIAVGYGAYSTNRYSFSLGNGSNNADSGVGFGAFYLGSNATYGVAVGWNAAVNSNNGIAIGQNTSVTGGYSIAIGGEAVTTTSNAIVLNGTGSALTGNAAGFFIKPVRNDDNAQTFSGSLQYDKTTGEIFYHANTQANVFQLTSKSTAVTSNGTSGQVTTHNAALAANTAVWFQVNNSKVTAKDTIVVNLTSGVSVYDVKAGSVQAGSFYIYLKNTSAGSLSEALTINYTVHKG